jgi:hypothetical protein
MTGRHKSKAKTQKIKITKRQRTAAKRIKGFIALVKMMYPGNDALQACASEFYRAVEQFERTDDE